MEVRIQRPEWGDRQRALLKAARKQRGHTQQMCVEELEALGAPRVTQPTLSQWASGAIARPPDAAIEAIASYCEAVDLPDGASRESQQAPQGGVGRGSASPSPCPADFSDVISPMTGERPLSDRQAALVDAVIERLRTSAGPLSPDDGQALQWVADVVGLASSGPVQSDVPPSQRSHPTASGGQQLP